MHLKCFLGHDLAPDLEQGRQFNCLFSNMIEFLQKGLKPMGVVVPQMEYTVS